MQKAPDNVGLPALDLRFDPLDGPGAVFQEGSQGEGAVLPEDHISLAKRCSSSSLPREANL